MKLPDCLRWGAMVVIAGIAVMRCAIVFAPQVVFDVDPAFDSSHLAGLGPAGSLVLDAILLAACGVALLAELLCGRGVNGSYFLFALLPAPVVLWHGVPDLGDLWIGVTWLAAMVAGVTVAHLARDCALRIVGPALLLAIVAPLLVRSIGQLTYEHTELVQTFEANKDRFLRQQGWAPDSPSARIYERRLRNPEPLGWFATTNIFASYMAVLLIAYLGLLVASIRKKVSSGAITTLGIVVAGSAVALYLCDSMGAMLATAGGLVVLLPPMVSSIARRWFARFGGAILPLVLVATIGGVWVRGALLPEEFAGDRSLLFRWHYTISSARILAEAPLTGVGPDGFQAAYVQHRVPRSPEEVTSPHNVFLGWLTSFGVLGVAWIVLIVLFLHRARAMLDDPEETSNDDDPELVRRTLLGASFIAVLGLGGAMLVETLVTLDPLMIMLRVMGAVSYAGLAVLIVSILRRGPSTWARWSLVAGVTALLIHGQIEMTFSQSSAVVWLMAVIALIGPLGTGSIRRGTGVVVAALVFALAGWIALRGAVPALRQQMALQKAAGVLANFPPDAPSRIQRRREAAVLLIEAHEIMPSNPHPIERAAQQLFFAAMRDQGSERIAMLRESLDLLQRSSHRDRGFVISLQAADYAELARTTGQADYWDESIEARRQLTRRDPNGNVVWQRLGDVLWEAGRRDEALEAYRRSLEADDAFELDPLKQFSEAERSMIEGRLEELQD